MNLTIQPDPVEFVLGESITGTVRWRDLPDSARSVSVHVTVESVGAGNTSRVTSSSVSFGASPVGEERFSIIADPALPPSYEGQEFGIAWKVHARVDIRRGLDVNESALVLVAPVGLRQWRARQAAVDQFPIIGTDRD